MSEPVIDEKMWEGLLDAEFSGESIRGKDTDALISYIRNLEAKLYDRQLITSCLLMEKEKAETELRSQQERQILLKGKLSKSNGMLDKALESLKQVQISTIKMQCREEKLKIKEDYVLQKQHDLENQSTDVNRRENEWVQRLCAIETVVRCFLGK